MTTNDKAAARLIGALLLTAIASIIASAAIVVPAGLTLDPADPADTLRAVNDRVELHLIELGLDVLGWLALAAAGLAIAAHGRSKILLPAGLLALAGAAGMLHDAGNLAVTQLAADPAATASARAVLLTAKWTVNLAGLLWVAATAAMAHGRPGFRLTGTAAALTGLASVALPWTTGTAGPTPAQEQIGYALHLPILLWWAALAYRYLRPAPSTRQARQQRLPSLD